MRYAVAAWVIAGALLVAALLLHLLPALLAGLLVYELVHVIAPRLPGTRGGDGKIAAVAVLAAAVVAVLSLILLGAVDFLQGETGSIPRLMQKMAEIVESSRGRLPDWLVGAIPGDVEGLKAAVIAWLHGHAQELRTLGGELGRILAHVVIGMVIGAMVSLREAVALAQGGPLSRALTERATRLGDAFRRVVFAQVRISLLNTLFTAIFLLAILPLAGVHLPLRKSLIAITLVAGLLPVVGNLISNTVMVVVALSVSLPVALASLAFLVVIHKLEYFLNARIVGAHIHARAWELLLAMLVMEAAFGLPGVIAAPIYYAYLKDELRARGLI